MLVGSTAWAAACDGFTDVDSANSTYCTAVTYLKDKGITLGCTGTTYCPNDYVTRLQMALFLQRAGRGSASNVLGDWTDAIGGGEQNTTAGAASYQVIGGGFNNSATGVYSAIAGGQGNQATGNYSFIGGGISNIASGISSSTIGYSNTASGYRSIAIGAGNSAAGQSSVVIGFEGMTTSSATGSFVFSDGTVAPDGLFTTAEANLFVVGATGGMKVITNKDYSTGCLIAAGGGTWQCTSSKDVKRDFEDIDRQQVLERVVALPVQRWRYMNEPTEIRHMGTFAQDFHAAFGLGSDDKTISMADADGVALAAIQGLNAKVEASDMVIRELSRELAEIKAQLAAVVAAH